MARRSIREYDAKCIITTHLKQFIPQLDIKQKSILITPQTNLNTLTQTYPWLNQTPLVIKPDQLFGKRKKLGLVLLNANLDQVKQYLVKYQNQPLTINKATGYLTHFLIEPYTPSNQEFYLALKSFRTHDTIYFSTNGGIDIEENWDQVTQINIPTNQQISINHLKQLPSTPENHPIHQFIIQTYQAFKELHFSYLEFNPFIINNSSITLLDTVAHLDDCAHFLLKDTWNLSQFPPEFGKTNSFQEEHINNLDQNSGASLKLSLINPQGKIYSILGGGGASIIYLDMIANVGHGSQIANYGETSGNPSTNECHEYAKSIFELMLKNHGKILFIVGGIANFTDIRNTFTGFIKAINEFAPQLKQQKVHIFVRRGGPHDIQGLNLIKEAAQAHDILITVQGPESPMPQIIQDAKPILTNTQP